MGYNTKNYTEQGGEKTVIGGILEVKEGGSLEIKEGALLKGFPIASNQANSTAATVNDLKDNFNDLLAKLKDAGFMGFDTWNLSVAKAPITTEGEPITENQSKVTAFQGCLFSPSSLFLLKTVPSMVGLLKVMESPLVARLVAGILKITR
jgi:hypothetical protein